MTYKETLSWLYSLQRFGIKLGLENIRRLLAALSRSGGFQAAVGDLEIALPWKVIHVAGTNGKGSVCAMVTRSAARRDVAPAFSRRLTSSRFANAFV